MYPPKKKKPGALVAMIAGLGGKKKPMEGEEDESSPDMESDSEDSYGEEPSEHDAAFNSLANALNIPAERRGRAKAALKQFVYACMKGRSPEGE